MLDYEKAILSIMINNIQSFDNTCLRKEYFLNSNYSKLFDYLNEYYKKHQNIDYIEIQKENKDFNSNLYLELEKEKEPIPDWEKSLRILENEIINNYITNNSLHQFIIYNYQSSIIN